MNKISSSSSLWRRAGVRAYKMAVSIAILALAVACTFGALALSPSHVNDPDNRLRAGSVRSSEGRMNLICLGGVERAVETRTNVDNVDEEISSATGVLLAGEAESFQQAQWQTYESGKQKPAKAQTLQTRLLDENNALSTQLKQPAFSGSLSIARSSVNEETIMGGFSHRAKAGDLRGLAYNACQWPTNEQWLVGSRSTVGSSNRLIVANPSRTSVQVHVRAFSSIGEIPLGTSSVVLLPPQSLRTVTLDGVIDNDERIALYLWADSGQFSATVQTSLLDGYTAAGIDFLSPGRSGQDLMIPGLSLLAGSVDLGGVGENQKSHESSLVDSSVSAAVRIVNPHQTKQKADVELIGADGSVEKLPGGTGVEISPGSVLDLSLDGVAPGDYAVHISSRASLAAGVQLTYASDNSGKDMAWLAAKAPIENGGAYIGLGRAHLVVTPEVVNGKARSASWQWTAYDSQGEKLDSQTVNSKGTSGLDLPEGSAYVSLTSSVPVYAAVVGTVDLAEGKGVAWNALSANALGTSTTRMYIHN